MSEIDAVAHAKALNEKRMKAWEEGKRLLDDVQKRGDGFSAEEQAQWDRINADIDSLDQQRDVYLQAEKREREAAELREADARVLGSEARLERSEFNERRYIADKIREISNSPAGPNGPSLEIPIQRAMAERQMIRDGLPADEARALAWDTGSVASAVPVTTARTLYQYLEAGIAMFKIPTVTKIQTATGEQMKFPKLGAHAIATQVSGQGTTLAGTDPSFLSMTLDTFKYGELVIVANEVLSDTVIDIGTFLGRDMGRALARKIDTDLTVGTGSGQPQGVMTAGIVGSNGTIATGGSLLTPSYENLADLVYSVNDEYRQNNPAFLTRDATAGILRKLRDGAGGTTGQVMWLPSPTQGLIGGQPDLLLGYPVYTDPNVASCASNAKIMAFGDFGAYYLRTVGNVMIDRDESRYFDTDQVGFRAKWRVDGDVIDTSALNILKQSV